MSIIKDGKQYGVETRVIVSDEFRDQLFSQTLEEVHSTTPVMFGRYLFAKQPRLRVADIVISDNITETYQYQYMFQSCTSLQTAPELPATSLKDYCYQYMFQSCTSLQTAPVLPATTLASYCYNDMFQNCKSLTQAPALPATKLESNCYSYMFYGCTSLTEAPELPVTTLATNCYQFMFYGCTSLQTAPDLPATTLPSGCYSSMFSGCKSLQKTGNIAAEGYITMSVSGMFNGCTSLKEMTWTATTPPSINSDTLQQCPATMKIYVPDSAVDAYKAASIWSQRAAYIKGISEKPA